MRSPSRRALLSALTTGIGILSGCARLGTDRTRTSTPTRTTRTTRETRATTTRTTEPTTEATTETSETASSPPRDVRCDHRWEPSVRWSRQTTTRAFAPTVFDGTVYFGSQDGDLYAVDAKTGRTKWRVDHRGVRKAPTVDSRGTVVVTGHNRATAYDEANGREQWSFVPPGDHARLADRFGDDGDAVYVGASRYSGVEYFVDDEWSRVYAFDRGTGERRWRTSPVPAGSDDRLVPDAVVAGGGRVFVVSKTGTLVALDTSTGTELWRQTFDGFVESPVVRGETVYVKAGHALLALDGRTGRTKWRGLAEHPPAISDGVVYASEDAVLRAYGADIGRLRWAAEIPDGGCGSTPLRVGDVLYLPTGCLADHGRIYAIDATSGCRLGYFAVRSHRPTTPAVAGDTLFTGGLNGEGRMWAVSIAH